MKHRIPASQLRSPEDQRRNFKVRKGTVFHPKAEDELTGRLSAFEARLEDMSVEQSKQDRSDSVSSRHVTRAYDSMVSPRRRQEIAKMISSGIFGASLSGFVSFFLSVPYASRALNKGEVLTLVVIFAAGMASTFVMAYNIRR